MKKRLIIGLVLGFAVLVMLSSGFLGNLSKKSTQEDMTKTSMHYELPKLLPSAWITGR